MSNWVMTAAHKNWESQNFPVDLKIKIPYNRPRVFPTRFTYRWGSGVAKEGVIFTSAAWLEVQNEEDRELNRGRIMQDRRSRFCDHSVGALIRREGVRRPLAPTFMRHACR